MERIGHLQSLLLAQWDAVGTRSITYAQLPKGEEPFQTAHLGAAWPSQLTTALTKLSGPCGLCNTSRDKTSQ